MYLLAPVAVWSICAGLVTLVGAPVDHEIQAEPVVLPSAGHEEPSRSEGRGSWVFHSCHKPVDIKPMPSQLCCPLPNTIPCQV